MARSTTEEDEISAFLEKFSTPLHHLHIQPAYSSSLWVFWSKDQINSSPADHQPRMPYHNIISAFSNLKYFNNVKFIVQFWAPATISGRRLLLTSCQPFAVKNLGHDLREYRLGCMEYQYNINHQLHFQQQQVNQDCPMIRSGWPASAFLNCMPEFYRMKDLQGSPLGRYALESELEVSYMLPICSPSQPSACIGVVECTLGWFHSLQFFKAVKKALTEAGLSICPTQERIPYKIINGLKLVKDDIEASLKIVCSLHGISLAHVWIRYEDENHVPFSSPSEDTQRRRIIALKLTGYVDGHHMLMHRYVKDYNDACDIVSLQTGEELVEKTLQDYKPRFFENLVELNADTLMAALIADLEEISGLSICLRSSDTDDFDYAFQFMWPRRSNYVIMLEALLLTFKRCFPHFKFASGAELGDKIHVIDAEISKDSERSFTIFKGKKSSPLPIAPEVRKKHVVVDSCGAKWKTAPKQIPREAIEGQFGNTMMEAANNLNVSLSTLKRKCKEYDICEWQGPNVVKRIVGASRINQSNRNEDSDGAAIQEPSIVNKNENILTIKAEYEDDTIKFDLHMSEATLANVEKEIGVNFNLSLGTYKLKYRDEDGDWILLGSDRHMKYCIERLRNSGQTVIRLRILPSQPKQSSYEICST